jgi:hypothetical protein
VKAINGFGRAALTILALGATAISASAQSPPLIHGDATATIGWLSANIPSSQPYDDNDWLNSLFGAGTLGWHWTDNLKSEVDFGVGTDARANRLEQIVVDGRIQYLPSTARFSRRTIGISQQYQFFHNVWFHPHLAAGANFTWERRNEEYGPIYAYDDATRSSRLIPPEQASEVETTLTVRPFVAIGFKAYLTNRLFFRNDMRIAIRGGPDETLLRLGFGVDF